LPNYYTIKYIKSIMEFPSDQIEKAVYYVLTLNPNKTLTFDELYDLTKREKVCPSFFDTSSKTTFKNKCLNISKLYDHIETHNETMRFKIKNEYEDLDLMSLINSSDIKFDAPYRNGQSILHILCLLGRTDLLEVLANNFELNFNTTNNEGKTLMNISDDPKILRTIHELSVKQLEQKYKHEQYDLKLTNSKLLKSNTVLLVELKNIDDRQNCAISMILVVFLLFILYLFLF